MLNEIFNVDARFTGIFSLLLPSMKFKIAVTTHNM